jgi:hypothetical protein
MDPLKMFKFLAALLEDTSWWGLPNAAGSDHYVRVVEGFGLRQLRFGVVVPLADNIVSSGDHRRDMLKMMIELVRVLRIRDLK